MIPARSHELRTYSITISIEQVQQIYSQEHNLSSSKHAVSGGQKKNTHYCSYSIRGSKEHTTGHPYSLLDLTTTTKNQERSESTGCREGLHR